MKVVESNPKVRLAHNSCSFCRGGTSKQETLLHLFFTTDKCVQAATLNFLTLLASVMRSKQITANMYTTIIGVYLQLLMTDIYGSCASKATGLKKKFINGVQLLSLIYDVTINYKHEYKKTASTSYT